MLEFTNVHSEKNWSQDFREALKSAHDLETFFGINCPEVLKSYPVFIPRSFAKIILESGENSPLWKQFIPSSEEVTNSQGLYDPIADGLHSKGHGIIHRYKQRLLFTPTSVCPINCRYCFRKNELANKDDIFSANTEKLIAYLGNHPEVSEVILTGGDPLILSNKKLHKLIEVLAEKVPFLRFHTRTPIILPSRIDEEFIDLIAAAREKFSQLNIVIHVNHKDELYPAVRQKLKALNSRGINLLTQSVLLKGVNDSVESLVELFLSLAKMNIRPYYLHHPDQAKGTGHFQLELEEGRRLYAQLREELPGWAIPQYIIDHPNGQGKTQAFNPENFYFSGELIDRFGQKHSIDSSL